MEISEIRYINDRTIEILGEIDIDVKAESIHLGCYCDGDSCNDWREYAHIEILAFPHVKLKDLENLFRWINENTGVKDHVVEDGSGRIVKIPTESNWKLTLERID